MPVSDHYNRYEKLAVRIITVDTSALRVEGVGKDAAVIQISVGHRPPGFRWPIEGELWIIEREASDWALVSKIEDPDSLALSDGEPGDLMGPDGYIPQHKIKATSGQGLIWTTDGWVPQNLATQVELDAHVALTGTAHILPVVNALPGSPVDGQVCYYQDAGMATAGLVWTFRYRTASASSYKWESVGGPPLVNTVATNENTGSGSPVDLATVGPSLTIPLAGEYDFGFGAFASGSLATYYYAVLKFGAATADIAVDAIQFWGDAGANTEHRHREIRRTIAAASTVVKMQYAVGSGTGAYAQRQLIAAPVRVG